MIWTSFSVRVRTEAAAHWRTVARYRGFPSVGAWLAALGEQDSRRDRGAAGRWAEEEAKRQGPRLSWVRGRFAAAAEKRTRLVDREVAGILVAPFGIFREDESFTLVHLPTGRHLLSLPRRKDCQEAAEELLAQNLAWHASDPYKVMVGPGVEIARAILARARRGEWPSPIGWHLSPLGAA